MKVTGPFKDKKKRALGQARTWYLRVISPKQKSDGSPEVDVGGKVMLRRERPFFFTKEEAEAEKVRLESQHEATGDGRDGMISREQLVDLERARQEVPDIPLVELAKFWRLHHPRQSESTVRDFLSDFLADVKVRNGETRHHGDLKSRLKSFTRAMGDRVPATITRQEILNYLLGLAKSGRTVLNHKRAICNFFGWLLEKGYTPTNVAGGIKHRQLPRVARKEIVFLPLDKVSRYLRALERYDPGLVAHEVVQLFSGVRADDEMADFRAEWILPATREIVIPEAVAKMKRREVIAGLEPNFWAWWDSYGMKEGKVRPKNYMQRWRRVRILAEISDHAEADEFARLPITRLRANKERDQTLAGWPWNARRRTFCTYHVAKHQSADKTALILRHMGKASILHHSYRGLGVTPEQGKAYFDLMPMRVSTTIAPARFERRIIRLKLRSPKTGSTSAVQGA